MILEESIYPYNTDVKELPFYLTGLGGSAYQERVLRLWGYEWHQFLHCISGSGYLVADGVTTRLEEGSIVFLPKNRPHEYFGDEERWEVRWFAFDGSGCSKVLSHFGLTQASVVSGEIQRNTEIFEEMYRTLKSDVLYSGNICSGLVYDYIIAYSRLNKQDADKEKSRIVSALLPVLMRMSDNFSEDLSMEELAAQIGLTHQHFCHIFKKAMGMRPNEFLTNRRIDEAKRLLRDTDTSIAEVSARCGFNDPGYFSTVFRQHEGVSPSRFRMLSIPAAPDTDNE